MIVGYIVVAIGLVMVIFNGGNTTILFIGALFYGVAFSIQTVMLPLVCTKMFGPKDFPKLFSYATMGNALVGSMGIAINGAIFDAAGSYYPALVFVSACGIVAFLMLMFGMWRAHKVGFDKEEEAPAASTTVAAAKA